MEKTIYELHRMLKTTSNALMVQKGKGKDMKRKWLTKGKAKDNKKPNPNPNPKVRSLRLGNQRRANAFST